MSIFRRAKRRDETEPDIVKGLRKCGFMVRQQDFPDLIVRRLCWPSGQAQLLEVEGITKYRKRDEKQLEFLRDWQIPIVRSLEEALTALGSTWN